MAIAKYFRVGADFNNDIVMEMCAAIGRDQRSSPDRQEVAVALDHVANDRITVDARHT